MRADPWTCVVLRLLFLQVMAQLRRWWPSIPNPTKTFVTRWWTDPWTDGSYSNATTSCTGTKDAPAERKAFQTPQSFPANRVWFAGEHTSINYPATMQGAYLSGQSAAAAVIKVYPK